MKALKPPKHWFDLSIEERKLAVLAAGLPKFRAAQISRHLFVNFASSAADWSDVPLEQRDLIDRQFLPTLITPVREQRCDSDTTIKSLFRLFDGTLIESVLMLYGVPGVPASGTGRQRATLCISSQAGCGMGCPFCATGQLGLTRNLSAGEIVAQVVAANAWLQQHDLGRITNIVFMGMGEPLANYGKVLRAIRAIVTPAPNGLGLSARGITVSTVGLAPRIRKLIEEELPMTLAVSLHAPNDALRDELVPINSRYPLDEVVDAAKEYFAATGRRVSIEYALMRDINDSVAHAAQLAGLLNRRGKGWVHVNVIPLNPTPGSKWTAARRADQDAFVARLEMSGVPVTIRDTRGQEIDGACGQLAALELSER